MMNNKFFIAVLFSLLFSTAACQNNTPQETEEFVEKSTLSGPKMDNGTTGDVGNSAITFLPSFKDFGDVAIGEKSPGQVITLYNSSDYPVYLGAITLTNPTAYSLQKTDCPFTLDQPVMSGVSCRVYIQFTPVVGGIARGKIRLTYGLSFATSAQFGSSSDVTGSGISNLLFSGVGSLSDVKGNSVKVSWTHVVGANSYFVYTVDTNGVATLRGSVIAPGEHFVVTGLIKNTDYKVRVKAVDAQGVADGNTNDVAFKTLPENAPAVASVNPNAGPIAGGQTVAFYGSDFVNGAIAKIGSMTCASTTYVSATQLTCITAAGSAGVYAATVVNPDGQDGSLIPGYSYQPAPQVTGVIPSSGSWQGGTTVTITGSGFVTGAIATLEGVACASMTIDNPTTITCVTPARAAGATGGKAVDVVVTNADGQTGSMVKGYTYRFMRIDLLAGSLDPRGCRSSLLDPFDVRFDTPRGMTTDGTNIYVALYGAHVIYKVDPVTRSTTLFAGQPCLAGTVDGPSSVALLNGPHALQVLGSYLYFANYATHQIRRVHLTTGEVSTFAGLGSAGSVDGFGTAARFNGIWEMTTDGTYLYTIDTGADRVRKIDVSTTEVTTLAGSVAGNVDAVGAAARFNSPNGLVYAGGYLYVSETGNDKIRRVDVSDGTVTTFAGGVAGHLNGVGAAARFNDPRGLATDGTNLYVADLQVIRKIEISTAYTSVLSGVYNTPGMTEGAALDTRFYNTRTTFFHNGYVYVGEDSHTVRRVDATTGETTTWLGHRHDPYYAGAINGVGEAARFNGLRTTVYHDGYIYVADYNNHVVRRIDPSTQAVIAFTGTLGAAGGTDGTGAAARHNAPHGLAAHGDYLYVADYNGRTIRRVHIPSQNVETIVGSYGVNGSADNALGTSATLSNPTALAIDGTGTYMYVADYNNHLIRRIDLATTAVTTYVGSVNGTVDATGTAARVSYPAYLHITGTKMYFTSAGDHRVRMVDLTNSAVTSINSGTAGYLDTATTWTARFSAPRQLASDDTYLYVAEYNNHSIRKIDLTTLEVSTVTANLQPTAQATTSNKPMWNKTGLLTDEAAISWPYGISYNAAYGLVVTNDYGVFRLH